MNLFILVLVLIAYNLLVNRWLEQKWHLLFSVALSSLTIGWIVWDSTISLADIGISLDSLVDGLMYGAISLTLITLVITLTTLIPFMHQFFDDERSKTLSVKEFAYKTLVHIPISTVLWEEVIFRGVMLALLMNNFSTTTAVVISSLLFGIWHVLPAITSITTNKALKGFKSPNMFVVLGTVVVTFFAGVGFAWLRLASGSLLAPMIAHYVINTGGTVSAWVLHRLHLSKQKMV